MTSSATAGSTSASVRMHNAAATHVAVASNGAGTTATCGTERRRRPFSRSDSASTATMSNTSTKERGRDVSASCSTAARWSSGSGVTSTTSSETGSPRVSQRAILPIPQVIEIDEAFGAWYCVSTRGRGTPLEQLDAVHWVDVAPSVLTTLDALRRADITATTGYGPWNHAGNGPMERGPISLPPSRTINRILGRMDGSNC